MLLKARPTATQLADRLRPPLPEGLELYLDIADISEEGWLEAILGRIAGYELPADFAWVVEGPLRSLDGAFFNPARDVEADREVLRRIVACGERLGARAVVIHCIAPTANGGELTKANRERVMATAERTFTYYADLCQQHGLVPTIENVPPVARMRESAFVHSLIGMSPQDMVYFTDRVPGLMAVCDTSHAQLYVNAATAEAAAQPAALAPIVAYLAELPSVGSLAEYIATLGARIFEAHVANAAGLLDEGLPYDTGDADLAAAVQALSGTACYLATEPLEPEPEKAERMRAMAKWLMAQRARSDCEGKQA
ncbi:MAG: TIM barrel protein [Dehalococcoidales bacterium]|nr:TIM barrel protein [Dehalococcoidales bacterium]